MGSHRPEPPIPESDTCGQKWLTCVPRNERVRCNYDLEGLWQIPCAGRSRCLSRRVPGMRSFLVILLLRASSLCDASELVGACTCGMQWRNLTDGSVLGQEHRTIGSAVVLVDGDTCSDQFDISPRSTSAYGCNSKCDLAFGANISTPRVDSFLGIEVERAATQTTGYVTMLWVWAASDGSLKLVEQSPASALHILKANVRPPCVPPQVRDKQDGEGVGVLLHVQRWQPRPRTGRGRPFWCHCVS